MQVKEKKNFKRNEKLVEPIKVCGSWAESQDITLNVKKYRNHSHYEITIPKKVFDRVVFNKNDEGKQRINDPSFKMQLNLKKRIRDDLKFEFDIFYSDYVKYDLQVEKLKDIRVEVKLDGCEIEMFISKELYMATDWANSTFRGNRLRRGEFIRYEKLNTPDRACGGLQN